MLVTLSLNSGAMCMMNGSIDNTEHSRKLNDSASGYDIFIVSWHMAMNPPAQIIQ